MLLATCGLSQAVVSTGIAPTGDPGGFEIEGDLTSNTTALTTDWLDGPAGVQGILNNDGTVRTLPPPGVTYRRLDAYNTLDDVFAGSNQVNADPNTYKWQTGSANNKTDMNNVYVHVSVQNTTSTLYPDTHVGDRWITASADRLVTNGTSYVDFELCQAAVTKVTDPLCSVKAPCGYFVTNPLNTSTGGRTPGDVLITANYGQGGTVATMLVSEWQQVGGVWQ
jgi:hypothetical protein